MIKINFRYIKLIHNDTFRFASPVNLSALGYRLFTSPIQENLKNVPISPIGPEHANGFKSSTPTNNHRATPTVAERLALSAQRCASPNPALMNVISTEMKKQQQILTSGSDSGRSTPTNNYNNSNIILSPIKSTMSNEELFVAIHKSKKRLNIKGDETETLSPAGSLTSLSKNQQIIGTRHSWSPESQKTPEVRIYNLIHFFYKIIITSFIERALRILYLFFLKLSLNFVVKY